MKPTSWPDNKQPDREQIEWMYAAAYYVDSGIFRPNDLADFGLDLHRLKEFGQVQMKKGIATLRKHVPELWERMDQSQKIAFLLGRAIPYIKEVKNLMDNVAKYGKPSPEVNEALEMALNVAFAAAPGKFRKILKEGLLKKWAKTGS